MGRRRRRLRGLRRVRRRDRPRPRHGAPDGQLRRRVPDPLGRQHRRRLDQPRRRHPVRDAAPAGARRVPPSGLRGHHLGRRRSAHPGRSDHGDRAAEYYTGGALADAPGDVAGHDDCRDVPPAGLGALRLRTVVAVVARGRRDLRDRGMPFGSFPCCDIEPAKVETYTGSTDAAGVHALDLRVGTLDADVEGLPVTVRANAALQDVNRQTIAGTTDLLVHPADLYVGLGGGTHVRAAGPSSSASTSSSPTSTEPPSPAATSRSPPAARTVDSSAASGPRRSSTPRRAPSRPQRNRRPAPSPHRPAAPTASPPRSATTPVGSAGPRRPGGSVAPRRSPAAPSSARTSSSCRTPPTTSPARRPRSSSRRRSRRGPGSWSRTGARSGRPPRSTSSTGRPSCRSRSARTTSRTST